MSWTILLYEAYVMLGSIFLSYPLRQQVCFLNGYIQYIFLNIIQPWQEKEILPEWTLYLLVYLQAKQKNIIKDSDHLL